VLGVGGSESVSGVWMRGGRWVRLGCGWVGRIGVWVGVGCWWEVYDNRSRVDFGVEWGGGGAGRGMRLGVGVGRGFNWDVAQACKCLSLPNWLDMLVPHVRLLRVNKNT